MSDRQGIPMGILEKDYALTSLLSVIANFPKLSSLAFKGGTALKKMYFEDFRFSEDLDFACLEDVSDKFCNFIQDRMGELGVQFTEVANKERRSESFKFKIRYMQFNGRATSVKVDLSLRKDIVTKTSARQVRHPYGTLPRPFSVNTMSLEEIMAEKVRAVLYSKHPRHLYDLAFLYDHNVRLNPGMVRLKIKSVYEDEFHMDRFKEVVLEQEGLWTRDLQPLLKHKLPPFATVSEKMLEMVGSAMS